MHCVEHSSWIKDIVDKGIIPLLVGAISYLLFRGLDERKKRKSHSTLGVIIIDCLLEEVGTGIKILQEAFDPKVAFPMTNLPHKSWMGINTLPDEVMLRIISVSKDVKATGSFNPKDIRKHTKNYFDHMCLSWNSALIPGITRETMTATFKKYPEAAEGVRKMLVQTKQLLENNSKQLFPK
jgi:hypothetical protein